MAFSTSSHRSPSRRIVNPDGSFHVRRVGLRSHFLGDLYFHVVRISPASLSGLIFLMFIGINCIFAALYLLGGDCIGNARPGEFRDAFFFSVQTMAAVGYGVFHPITTYAHIVASLEALVGLLGLATISGVMFVRISRPTAKVLFSKSCVVSSFHGIPTLMIRLANQRLNRVLAAQAQVTLLVREVSGEGMSMRRFYDLSLVRAQTPIFGLSWTLMHPITAESPLHALEDIFGEKRHIAAEERERLLDTEIIVTVTGMDETLMQTVHSRISYGLEDIRWNCRFADIMTADEAGTTVINYHLFDTVLPESEQISNNQNEQT